ncbi:hypothetical protein GCM10010307_72560 [Streptomyces vastus]|uniref:Uncharacterized protein n=1 Tax=Streptomyces vastus TaxID=285451 RepID=A0ABN3RQ73_9ACTN
MMVGDEECAHKEQGDGGDPLHCSSHHDVLEAQPWQAYAILVRGPLWGRLCSGALCTRHGRQATWE